MQESGTTNIGLKGLVVEGDQKWVGPKSDISYSNVLEGQADDINM